MCAWVPSEQTPPWVADWRKEDQGAHQRLQALHAHAPQPSQPRSRHGARPHNTFNRSAHGGRSRDRMWRTQAGGAFRGWGTDVRISAWARHRQTNQDVRKPRVRIALPRPRCRQVGVGPATAQGTSLPPNPKTLPTSHLLTEDRWADSLQKMRSTEVKVQHKQGGTEHHSLASPGISHRCTRHRRGVPSPALSSH